MAVRQRAGEERSGGEDTINYLQSQPSHRELLCGSITDAAGVAQQHPQRNTYTFCDGVGVAIDNALLYSI